ncbi:MAG: zinc ribbon domain-containing protein [Leptolyngbya sp. PLA3]|nr:MAG: zinc ribbon domain-containing protein [Cyanobacteria bacterium CYA]MCE7968199.1 zinc ribbon domain-containing protein [Leptolyngbya sp. PL-A3]
MPTYDYRCGKCGYEFELFQSMSEPPKRKCPKCGRSALERLIGTGAAVLFKGSGFYQTDYRSENYKKAAKSESGETSSKPGQTSQTKPEPTTATKSNGKPKSGEKKSAGTSSD